MALISFDLLQIEHLPGNRDPSFPVLQVESIIEFVVPTYRSCKLFVESMEESTGFGLKSMISSTQGQQGANFY